MSKIMVRYEPVDVAPRRMPHNRATGPNTLARRNIVAAQQPRRQRVNLWSAKLLWMELESDATVQRAFRELVDGAFEGGFRFLLVPAQEAALPLGELMERGVEPPYLNKPGFKRVARAFDERALFSMYLLGAAPSPSNTPPPGFALLRVPKKLSDWVVQHGGDELLPQTLEPLDPARGDLWWYPDTRELLYEPHEQDGINADSSFLILMDPSGAFREPRCVIRLVSSPPPSPPPDPGWTSSASTRASCLSAQSSGRP